MEPVPRILVIDGERSLRNVPRLYPEREGYTVVEADDGLDALALPTPAPR